MLYTRASFITFLTKKHDCKTFPDEDGLVIKNGSARTYMNMTRFIDYGEIWIHCKKLYILSPPGDSELEKVE